MCVHSCSVSLCEIIKGDVYLILAKIVCMTVIIYLLSIIISKSPEIGENHKMQYKQNIFDYCCVV